MRIHAILAVLLLAGSATAVESEPTENMRAYAAYANELSERRRLNTFFLNEQSPIDGVQVGYVNVGAGNLTFLRKDLVRIERLPIVAGRVYDSRIEDGEDFGPGWKLATAETLEQTPAGLRYVNSAGVVYDFVSEEDAYVLAIPQPNDFLDISVHAGAVEITYRSLWSKRFEWQAEAYRLTEVKDNNGNALHLHYDEQGRMARIDSGSGHVTFARNASGRITAVTDDLSRTVRYGYDKHGRLETVWDLGSHRWAYRYNGQNQLKEVTDPRGRQALFASYQGGGKISQIRVRGGKRHFKYRGAETTVRDQANLVTVYTQHPSGITTHIQSPEGTRTELVLDAEYRVAELRRNGQRRASMNHDARGNLTRLTTFHDDGQVLVAYNYNWHDRVITADASDGQTLALRYDDNGNLVERQAEEGLFRYEFSDVGDLQRMQTPQGSFSFAHSSQGLITQISRGGAPLASLGYAPTGRVEAVSFPDGRGIQYAYDDLGLRRSAQFSTGYGVDYYYDPAGNLVRIDRTQDGTVVAVGSFSMMKTRSWHSIPAKTLPRWNMMLGAIQCDCQTAPRPRSSRMTGLSAWYRSNETTG